jgi:excisionase family DNA binding protein
MKVRPVSTDNTGVRPLVTRPVNDIIAVLEARITALTIAECAELLNVGTQTLYDHTKAHKFPAYEVCGSLRVNPAELVAYLKTNAKHGTQYAKPASSTALPERSWDRRYKR